MKKFSELGVTVQDERKMFNCSQVSISDVLNCEIIVEDFIPDVKTSHGEGSLKKTLDQIPKDAFPFSTTIKGMKCGNGKIYQFT